VGQACAGCCGTFGRLVRCVVVIYYGISSSPRRARQAVGRWAQPALPPLRPPQMKGAEAQGRRVSERTAVRDWAWDGLFRFCCVVGCGSLALTRFVRADDWCLRCWAWELRGTRSSALDQQQPPKGKGNVAIICRACDRGCALFEEQGQATPTLRRLTTKGKSTVTKRKYSDIYKTQTALGASPPTALRSLGITPQRTRFTVIIVHQLAARHLTRPIAVCADREVLLFAFLVEDINMFTQISFAHRKSSKCLVGPPFPAVQSTRGTDGVAPSGSRTTMHARTPALPPRFPNGTITPIWPNSVANTPE
jgi:hypothetical protein